MISALLKVFLVFLHVQYNVTRTAINTHSKLLALQPRTQAVQGLHPASHIYRTPTLLFAVLSK